MAITIAESTISRSAVDGEGEVFDFLVQRRRSADAAKKVVARLLDKPGHAPSRTVTCPYKQLRICASRTWAEARASA